VPIAPSSKKADSWYIKYKGPYRAPDDAIILTVREAAYLLRVSTKTVMKWATRKKNPAPLVVFSKGLPRFPREALIKWATQTKDHTDV
jgi:excisionase family DNA binding protein